MSFLQSILNALGGEKKLEPDRSWPSPLDVGRARNADFGYGTGFENFLDSTGRGKMPQFEGLPTNSMKRLENLIDKKDPSIITPEIADAMAQAALAANRSAVAGLGFDPRRMAVITGEKDLNINGAYSPEKDRIYNLSNNPSTYVHEAGHRGLQMLREAGAKVDPNLPAGDEEVFVRAMMRGLMGDTEKGEVADSYRARAKLSGAQANYDESIRRMEAAAAQEIKRRRPGGPR